MSGQKRAKKWRFGDFEVPPDWKEGVKSKNCYDRSISRAKLPPCTNFQRKIRQNVPGYTLGFFCTNTPNIPKKREEKIILSPVKK